MVKLPDSDGFENCMKYRLKKRIGCEDAKYCGVCFAKLEKPNQVLCYFSKEGIMSKIISFSRNVHVSVAPMRER